MHLLDKDDLKKVTGGAGLSNDWISEQERKTGNTRVNTGLKKNDPPFVPPIVEQHYWR